MKKGSIKYVLWFVVAAFALLLAILFLRRVFESTNQVIDDSECANEIKTHVTMMHLLMTGRQEISIARPNI